MRSRRYGLTEDEFDKMHRFSAGCCDICDEAPLDGMLMVDHNHATGEVRGLLCRRCNVGLGGFRDDPYLMTKAMDYLADPPVLEVVGRRLASITVGMDDAKLPVESRKRMIAELTEALGGPEHLAEFWWST